MRCVRSHVPWTAPLGPRFKRTQPVTGQPVVRDNHTLLQWRGCADGLFGDDCSQGSATSFSWSDALDACRNSGWSGFDNWRLPSVQELRTIANFDGAPVAVFRAEFPNMPLWASYCSSTTNPADPNRSLTITFSRGNTYELDKRNEEWECLLLCVRTL